MGTVDRGARPQTLIIEATVDSALTPQTNTATISARRPVRPQHRQQHSASATETPQQADLALTKTVSNPTPNVGDTITFTVTLTNNGPDTATGVQVSDLLPAGLSFVSATPSQGTYDTATGLWTVGTVAVGNAPDAASSRPPSTAPVTADQHGDDQPRRPVRPQHRQQHSASATETPQQADLAVTKTVSNPTPNVGDTSPSPSP